jgi:hypothetical protein
MSRAQITALKTYLEGLTFTDTALPGGSVSLAGRVTLLGPTDPQPQGGAPMAYVLPASVDASAEGIMVTVRSTYQVAIVLPVATASDALLVGAEVLSTLAAAVYRELLGAATNEAILSGGGVHHDRQARTVTCFGTLTLSLLV